jgi:hypothetical protein
MRSRNALARVPKLIAFLLVLTPWAALADPAPWLTRETKLSASGAAADDAVGLSVSISGDTAVVGAPFDSQAGSRSGSAYVFVRSGGVWRQQQRLTASDAAGGDQFGWSVAASGDTAVIGSLGDSGAGYGSGSAYVFVRQGGVWRQQQKLVASDAAAGEAFGISVALDGETAVVGAYADSHGGDLSGAAYVFARSGGVWIQQQKLKAGDAAAGEFFGFSVALNADTAVVGAPFDSDNRSGSAYVFLRNGGVWSQQRKLTASDPHPPGFAGGEFGYAVAVSGDTAVVGSPFDYEPGIYDLRGSAYVFVRNGAVWSQQQKLAASEVPALRQFGWSVAIRGDTAVIGAPFESSADFFNFTGAAYVFSRSSGGWSRRQKLTASDASLFNHFGWSVAVHGDTALAGSPFGQLGANPGSAYVYEPELTALSPAKVWVGLKNSDDVGIRFDLQARVYLNGSAVGSGHLDSVSGGSSGFNNATLSSIPLTLTVPVAAHTGDTLAIEVLVRNACAGSGKSSGMARLWYNGQPMDSGPARDAGSRFDAVIGGTDTDYFLRENSALSSTAGDSKLSVDRAAGGKCAAFSSFGSWSASLP